MKPSITYLISCLLLLSPFACAERELTSNSLNTCQDNSSFSATLFDVVFTPSNHSLAFNVNGVSTTNGNITIDLIVYAYGLKVYTSNINPCGSSDFSGLCPMNEGQIDLNSNVDIDPESLAKVPGIAYTVPDLDAKVQVYFNSTTDGSSLACVEAELSNGKTVYQPGVGWTVAVISGLALVASAITSGLGHSNTAAHVAANAMALFGYFQAQAFIGMTAVPLPPIVSSWTQNFQWSMGIIRVTFLQTLATWYLRSTGGTPSTVLSSLSTYSVEVQKRSLDALRKRTPEAMMNLMKRAAIGLQSRDTTSDGSDTPIILRGIERVGFHAHMEITNIFMTGYIFFLIFVLFVVIGVVAFKFICEGLVKAGHMKGDKFSDFRNGWKTVLKGILFRVVLIGYPQMVVLCFWEFTVKNSGGEVVLAVFTIFPMIAILAWASAKVIRLARRSIAMHKNPAYILYSDPVALNKWGFLYVQFKATAYFWIVPFLIYILIKGLFVGLGQGSGTTQAISLVVIEAVYLIAVCVMRPYMDKKTNGFNIAICVINFLSAIFLLVFTGIFDQPGIVTGVMGVIFFVYNAAFSTILLVMVLIASFYAIWAKNPESRYQPMRDDRGSFIKSQSQLNTELDALGIAARGESKHDYTTKSGVRIDDDEDSWSGNSSDQTHVAPQTQYTGAAGAFSQPPRSPAHSTSNFPSGDGNARHLPPYERVANSASPAPYDRSPSMTSSQHRFRQQQNASPWQRGAGYE